MKRRILNFIETLIALSIAIPVAAVFWSLQGVVIMSQYRLRLSPFQFYCFAFSLPVLFASFVAFASPLMAPAYLDYWPRAVLKLGLFLLDCGLTVPLFIVGLINPD